MRSHKRPIWAALLLILVLTATAAGTAYAYLSNKSNTVTGNMTPATEFVPNVVVDGTNIVQNLKVDIGEPGYAVYVRATILVTWQKDSGEIYIEPPTEGTDYILNWNDTQWFRGADGFYYHKARVNSGADTGVLLNSLDQAPGASPPDAGYSIHVDVAFQTIQAYGSTDANGTPAVTDAWGVTVDANGELVP